MSGCGFVTLLGVRDPPHVPILDDLCASSPAVLSGTEGEALDVVG